MRAATQTAASAQRSSMAGAWRQMWQNCGEGCDMPSVHFIVLAAAGTAPAPAMDQCVLRHAAIPECATVMAAR